MKFPRSEENYKNLFQSSYVLTILFGIFSTSLYYILFSPLLLTNIITNFNDSQNLFVIILLLHFLTFPAIFVIVNKSQTPQKFFKYITLLYLISTSISFYDFVFDRRALLLSLCMILYVILLALASTYIWQEIHVKKRLKKSFVLLLPILLIPRILDICDQIRMPLGIYLNELSGHTLNIFFLDVGGFFFIFVNFILAIFALVIVKITGELKK